MTEVMDYTSQKFLGVYPQKQDGYFMQRVKVFGGRISWEQWRKLASLAALYSQNTPLHLTTRQDVELHNVMGDDLAVIHQQLNDAGLNCFGSGGDSLRNITLCSCCGEDSNGFDLLGLAEAVDSQLKSLPGIEHLPRKFKISFSGSSCAGARPWLNDLGFIAQDDGLFTVIGAGSLGAKPALGIELYKDLSPNDVIPLCVASVKFFAEHGDRENRRKARFRHIRERLGDEKFKAEVDTQFSKLRSQNHWPSIEIKKGNGKSKLLYRLQLPNGNIFPVDALALADVAEVAGASLRINLEHGLEIYGPRDFEINGNLKAFASNPIITACPGATTCTRGLTDCWATADRIREKLTNEDAKGLRINISGCPNNCAQSCVADIGLSGMLRKRNGESEACYKIFTNGGNGQNDKMATADGDAVFDAGIPETIKRIVEDFS